MRAGLPLTHTIQFASGFPDANVSWALVDGNGTAVASGSVTPEAGAISININIGSVNNTLSGGQLYAFRELTWEYEVDGVFQTGLHQYRIVARLPFGISENGVRQKLGVEAHEVEDDEIDLLAAYLEFERMVTPAALAAFGTAYVAQGYTITQAIEALAAIALLPTLQVRIANKESSGTNQFQRQKIDWALLEAGLLELINEALVLVDPTIELLGTPTTMFVVVERGTTPFPS